ncbi:MAG: GPW/gp25 family protein [Proteobacteria bacterium]|nr:GPW/gp25 family protein [Pseudomonadota bacterium]
MSGIDARTFKVLDGWEHVAQSLDLILSTLVGERVMRRAFGFDGTAMQDRPMNAVEITNAFMAIAEAIEPRFVNGHQYGEPRFDLVRVTPKRAEPAGLIEFELQGLYYPRGHLGDFTVFEPKTHSLSPAPG